MPAPWNPPNSGNVLSLYQEDYQLYHDKAWYFRIPVHDMSDSEIDLSDPACDPKLYISSLADEGSATVIAPVYGEIDGIVDRIFDWDFVNELAVGTYFWECYVTWATLSGTRQLVGRGKLYVAGTIAHGL